MIRLTAVGGILLLFGITVWGEIYTETGHALVFDADSFRSDMEKKPHFVMIYTSWSTEVRSLEETFDRLSEKFNTKESMERIVLAKVNCSEVSELCTELSATGNTTFALFANNGTLEFVYFGDRDYKSMNNFLEGLLGNYQEDEHEVPVPQPKKFLLELTENDFDNIIAVGHHFIKFYAPWCGHCQRLAPIWEELAKTFEHQDWLSVGKVDCTQQATLCSKNNVRKYPTLIYFTDGRKTEEYDGARDHQSLKSYVMKHRPMYGTGNGDMEEEYTDEGIPIRDYVIPLTDEMLLPQISKGTNFVMFFDPECVHCKLLLPDWTSLALIFIKDDIRFSKLDCTAYAEVCTQQAVSSLPTLVLFRDGKRMEKYDGIVKLDSLKEFVMYMKTLPAPDDEHPEEMSFVVDLNLSNFDHCMEEGFCFVNFFKPWCDFCKNLTPVWEDLAIKFSNEKDVTIAKVDCTVSNQLCEHRGVEYYPTMLFYQRGRQTGFYTGPHDLESLYNYVSTYLQHVEL